MLRESRSRVDGEAKADAAEPVARHDPDRLRKPRAGTVDRRDRGRSARQENGVDIGRYNTGGVETLRDRSFDPGDLAGYVLFEARPEHRAGKARLNELLRHRPGFTV